jgi:hypothetical protein
LDKQPQLRCNIIVADSEAAVQTLLSRVQGANVLAWRLRDEVETSHNVVGVAWRREVTPQDGLDGRRVAQDLSTFALHELARCPLEGG